MYKSILWIRNKLSMDNNLTYFLTSELNFKEKRVSQINKEKIKLFEKELKEHSAEQLLKIFTQALSGIDLDIAPKLYVLLHLVIKMLPTDKRKAMASKLELRKISYMPNIKRDLNEKNFCEFLSFYAFYLAAKFEGNDMIFSVYEETVHTERFISQNVLKDRDLSLVICVLKSIHQAAKTLQNFLKLDHYFYLEPKPNRIEANIIGLFINDIAKLFNFLRNFSKGIEGELLKIQDDEFFLCAYQQYAKTIRSSQMLEKIFEEVEEFVSEYLLTLPELYNINLEINKKLEIRALSLKKIIFPNLRKYEKNLTIPKNLNVGLDPNWELLNQPIFTANSNPTSEDEGEDRIKKKKGKGLEFKNLEMNELKSNQNTVNIEVKRAVRKNKINRVGTKELTTSDFEEI